jgi:hypothetical protein
MDEPDFDDLALRWWSHDSDAFDAVIDWVEIDDERIIAFIQAAVRVVPPDQDIAYLGASIIEDLQMEAEFHHRAEHVLELLVATGLPVETVIRILAGVWPRVLGLMNLRERLGHVIPPDRIDWLLDRTAEGRGDYL